MRQPTLLKFNDIDCCNCASHNMVLMNVIDQLLQLDFEHLGYQIRSILRLLSKWQHSLDFKPLGIANQCNKRIRVADRSVNYHGILIILNHVTWTYCERRWQNDPLSDGSSATITCSNGVLKALIKIRAKFFLIQAQVLQAVLFNSRISIHNVLMPQSVTPKQRNAISVLMLKSITIKFGHFHIAMFSLKFRFFCMLFIQIYINNNTIERNIRMPSILTVRK